MGETLLYLSNSEPGPYYGTPQSEYEWSFPPALLVLICICLVGLILPSLVAKFFYFRSHQNHTPNSKSSSNHSTRSNNKDDDDGDDDGDGDGKLSSFQSKMIAWWKDGLYIQFAARPTLSEMMKASTDEIDASLDVNQKGIDTIHSSRKMINHLINTNTDRVIGPGCVVKESDIRSYYYGNSNNNNTNTRTRTKHHYEEEDECCYDDDCGNDLFRRSCEDDGNVEMVSAIRQRQRLATASTATTRSTTTTKSTTTTGTTRSAITTRTATAGTIREEVCNNINGNVDDKVVFVLRLSLGLLATGHCTVDVETTALKVAAALQLPTPRLSIGHRLFQASFGNTCTKTSRPSPTHLLTCKRDFVFSTLKELQLLADAVVAGEIPPRDISIALHTLNKIVEAPLPYGRIIYDLVFVGIGPWATIAAYYGSYYDMVGACLLSPVTVLSYRLCEYYQISHLEEIVVPFMIGLLTPLVWRYTNGGQDLCHITPMYMGALLLHLPGAEIVWGVLEILQGSVVHGASRLVKGLISAICLAVFVTLGFQVFGRNLAQNWLLERDNDFQNTTIGAVASLPDSQWCSNVKEPYYPEYFNWYFIIGVYNIPLNILCLMNVYIPIRDFVGPFIVGQVGLLSLGYLQFQCTAESCEVAGPIQNLLSAYFATWIAMLFEAVSGLPSPVCVIPVLFIFAPGSSAVLAIVGQMHASLGDTVGTNTAGWDSLAMQAFSYGVGIYLAQETWKPFLKGKFISRRRTAIIRDKKINIFPSTGHDNNVVDDECSSSTSNNNIDYDHEHRNHRHSNNHHRDDGDTTTMTGGNDSISLIDLDLHLDENFHAPQTVVHGNNNGYQNRLRRRRKSNHMTLADEIEFLIDRQQQQQ